MKEANLITGILIAFVDPFVLAGDFPIWLKWLAGITLCAGYLQYVIRRYMD